MSVVWVHETTNRSGKDDADTNRNYVRTFQVLTSTAQDGAVVVLAHPEIPAVNATYAYVDDSAGAPVTVEDPDAVVVDRQARQDDGDNLCNWAVTVTYAGVDDPVAQPAEVEYSPTRFQKYLVEDVNGNPCVNAAGDPFEGGVAADRTRFTLVVTKNRLAFDPQVAEAFQDSTNLNPFLVGYSAAYPAGFPAETCKLTIGAKRVRRAGTLTFYWQVRFEIDIDTDGWVSKPRDAGYRVKGSDGAPREFIYPDGTRPSSPILLDADGTKLPAGEAPRIAGPLGAGFRVYQALDWSILEIEY